MFSKVNQRPLNSVIKYNYYINTNEIPGELSRENMICLRVKITHEKITAAMVA